MAKRKLKLPKKIAGVKIPKAVRKGPVGQFLHSSAGQLLVAEALIAASGAFFASDDTDAKDGARRVGRASAVRGDDAKKLLERRSARLPFAFGEAVRAFRVALTDEDASAPPVSIEGEVAKKMSSSSHGTPHPH